MEPDLAGGEFECEQIQRMIAPTASTCPFAHAGSTGDIPNPWYAPRMLPVCPCMPTTDAEIETYVRTYAQYRPASLVRRRERVRWLEHAARCCLVVTALCLFAHTLVGDDRGAFSFLGALLFGTLASVFHLHGANLIPVESSRIVAPTLTLHHEDDGYAHALVLCGPHGYERVRLPEDDVQALDVVAEVRLRVEECNERLTRTFADVQARQDERALTSDQIRHMLAA